MDMNRPRDWGTGCGTLRRSPHRGSPERSSSRGPFSWVLVAPELGYLSGAPERRGSSNYIPWVTFLLFFPRKIFTVIIKTWTSQIRAPQKSFSPSIFFFSSSFPFFSPWKSCFRHMKAFCCLWNKLQCYRTIWHCYISFNEKNVRL